MRFLEKNLFLYFSLDLVGKNYIASHWAGHQTLAYHWLDKFANSTPAYLTIGQSYAA
jgi:hypothetical protein